MVIVVITTGKQFEIVSPLPPALALRVWILLCTFPNDIESFAESG